MSSSELSDVLCGVRGWPGGGFVVEGAGLEAAVQDADESVGELADRLLMPGAACAKGVVVGAGAGRGLDRGERLGGQRVDEPVVADMSGGDCLLPTRLSGDRGRAGVVLPRFRGGVAVGIVTEPGRVSMMLAWTNF